MQTTINPYEYVIQFGKHNGKSIDEISEIDPSYIVWLHENVKTITIPQEYVDAIKMDIYDREDEFLDAWGGWMSRYG
jgi:hypothetical protein